MAVSSTGNPGHLQLCLGHQEISRRRSRVEGRCDRCSRQGSAVPLSVTVANRPVTPPVAAPPPDTDHDDSAPPGDPTAHLRRFWCGDIESGNFSQWEGVFRSGPRTGVSRHLAPQGRQLCRRTVAPRQMASSVAGAKPASTATRTEGHRMVIHRKWSSNEDMGFGEIWYDVLPAGADRWDDPDKNADRECGSCPHASGHLSQQRDGVPASSTMTGSGSARRERSWRTEPRSRPSVLLRRKSARADTHAGDSAVRPGPRLNRPRTSFSVSRAAVGYRL
jgi:hypothetical protein